MKLSRRLAAVGLSATFLAAASLPVMQQSAAANDCPVVEVISAPGSGATTATSDPNNFTAFEHTRALTQRYPGKVRGWQIPYASSVGIALSLNPAQSLPETLPYGASAQQGVERGLNRMRETKAACPGTKFIVTGYSQGATVAGDIAAAVAQGKAPGVNPDDLEAAYLISDPGRSVVTNEKVTTHTGAVGRRSAAGEVLIDIQQANPGGSVGLTGPRPDGSFNGADRRVMSFCSRFDLACDTPKDGFFMNLGKAMYEWRQPGAAHYGPGLTWQEAVQGYGGFLVPTLLAVENGNENGVRRWTEVAAGNFLNKLPQAKKDAMRQLGEELAVVARTIRQSPSIPKFVGPESPESSTILSSVVPRNLRGPGTNLGRIMPHAAAFGPMHGGYFNAWTINNKPVEQWIIDDAIVRIDWLIAHS